MEDLAARLWQARQEGSVIDPATVVAPASLEEAYAIQDRVTALSGERIVGFKIGSTSVEAQRTLGTDQPGSGPLLARYVRSSPARLALVPDQMPCVEGEFAFRLGRDLPSRAEPYVRDDLVAALDAVSGAIEVVGSRIAGGLGGKGRYLVTADGGVNIGLIVGT
jgi:2-keto-4-pentenoate hydratase